MARTPQGSMKKTGMATHEMFEVEVDFDLNEDVHEQALAFLKAQGHVVNRLKVVVNPEHGVQPSTVVCQAYHMVDPDRSSWVWVCEQRVQ